MRGSAECKNHNSIISIYGVTVLPKFLQYSVCREHISESIEGYIIKLDTVIEYYQKKCRVQEQYHMFLQLSPFLIFAIIRFGTYHFSKGIEDK